METTSPEAVGLSSLRLQRINMLMQEYIEQQKLAGVITLVARRGQIAHWGCFGQIDAEANKPMQPDAILRLFSMTKPITSTALLMLYEEGHFQLDDPVSHFIPGIAKMKVCDDPTAADLRLVEQEQVMTMRQLLTHTSGLPSESPDDSALGMLYKQAQLPNYERTLHEMVQILVELPLMFQPGTRWRYSLATDVVGYLVELISGMPFDAFLEQRIFGPLGMKDTGFFVPPEKLERLAAVHGSAERGGLVRIDTAWLTLSSPPIRFLSGGGGLVSTAADYLRFAQMLLNGGELGGTRLLSRKTIELMTRNHLSPSLLPSYRFDSPQSAHYLRGHGFGLGVRVMEDVAQSGVLGSKGEYGWSGAANTCVWIDPKEEMICLLLPQHMPLWYYPIDRQFKVLVYQAIAD
jgi:CubicO group peptidase (beta-lactamase class C family)